VAVAEEGAFAICRALLLAVGWSTSADLLAAGRYAIRHPRHAAERRPMPTAVGRLVEEPVPGETTSEDEENGRHL